MGKHLLKDCPFCGGKAEQKYSVGMYGLNVLNVKR